MGKPKAVKLTTDQESKLIQAVEEETALFDKRDASYHKNRNAAWERVVAKVNCEELDVGACRTAWSSLRGQYMAFKRKVAKPSGSASGNRPYFRHEKAMMFLNDKTQGLQNETYSNLGGPSNGADEDDEEAHDHENNDELENVTPPTAPASSNVEHRSHTKFNSKRKLDPFDESLLNLLKNEDEKDEYALFGEVVAAKLRSVSQVNKQKALQLQNDINVWIYNAEMELC